MIVSFKSVIDVKIFKYAGWKEFTVVVEDYMHHKENKYSFGSKTNTVILTVREKRKSR